MCINILLMPCKSIEKFENCNHLGCYLTYVYTVSASARYCSGILEMTGEMPLRSIFRLSCYWMLFGGSEEVVKIQHCGHKETSCKTQYNAI